MEGYGACVTVCLVQLKNVTPYVLHMTWIYGGQAGKRSRAREAGLWIVEDESYYTGSNFLYFDPVDLPPVTDRQIDRQTGRQTGR
jgi:hypothetical protein